MVLSFVRTVRRPVSDLVGGAAPYLGILDSSTELVEFSLLSVRISFLLSPSSFRWSPVDVHGCS